MWAKFRKKSSISPVLTIWLLPKELIKSCWAHSMVWGRVLPLSAWWMKLTKESFCSLTDAGGPEMNVSYIPEHRSAGVFIAMHTSDNMTKKESTAEDIISQNSDLLKIPSKVRALATSLSWQLILSWMQVSKEGLLQFHWKWQHLSSSLSEVTHFPCPWIRAEVIKVLLMLNYSSISTFFVLWLRQLSEKQLVQENAAAWRHQS